MVLKILGLLVSGVAAGLVLATLVNRHSDWEARGGDSPISSATSSNGSRDVVEALRADIDWRLAAIEERLTALASEIEAVRGSAASTEEAIVRDTPLTPEEILERSERTGKLLAEIRETRRVAVAQHETEQLLAAGFSLERIEWIKRRSEELKMERMQAAYERRRDGQPPNPNYLLSLIDPDVALQAEMGDVEYERYLNALGRPTAVGVTQVLAGSPAERAGLQPGDEIVGYGGERVFSLAQLNTLSFDGEPGESIVVDVRRDGQTMQFVLPGGPLGIASEPLDLLQVVR